jgi:hypothetical protein
MAQVLTAVAVIALAGYLLWRYSDRLFERAGLRLTIRIDKSTPGAHLIWDILNTGTEPVTVTKLIVHGRNGAGDTVPLGLPRVLASDERLVLPTDVDWNVLAAKSIAVVDASGAEHLASRSQLVAIQDELRQHIDRRAHNTSARDFLSGAADLAFGAVILGLGFFMLMWVIATG